MTAVILLLPLAAFVLIFGLRYLQSRERMAMIQNGLDPLSEAEKMPRKYWHLRLGLLLIGAGMGLFIAYILDNYVFLMDVDFAHRSPGKNVPIYFSLLGIFGGLGLIISYIIEKIESRNNR